MNINHMNEEISKANNHINDENINKIILIGESLIVKQNMANGVPKARKAHPKNSATVILITFKTINAINIIKIKKKIFFDLFKEF